MTETCIHTRLTGCGGKLCMACRRMLVRFEVLRYPQDAMGAPMLDAEPETLTVCGFTAASSSARTSAGALEIPGRRDGGSVGLRMTIAAAPEGGLKKHDRVTVGGTLYRVTVAKRGTPAVAVLVETEA